MNIQRLAKEKLKSVKNEFHSELWRMIAPDLLFYVISHERSGTHFTINNILKNIFIKRGYHNIGEWFGPYTSFRDRFNHIEKFNTNWEKAYQKSSIIKSHCDRDLFEASYKKARVIYVLRDPRDTLTSWFHYLNRDEYYWHNPTVPDHRCTSFSEFLRRPISHFLRYSYSLHGNFSNVVERWISHVSGWLDMPDTLVVRYENLQRDHKLELMRICEFLELRPRRKIRSVGLNDAPSILPRKGIIGDWKSLFSASDEAFVQYKVEHAGMDWSFLVK